MPIVAVVLLLCMIPAAALCDTSLHRWDIPVLESVTGVVQGTPRNGIDIYDERQRRPVRFIYMGGEFQKGDYVRVYYRPSDRSVQFIRRLRALHYDKNGRNLGDVYRRDNL